MNFILKPWHVLVTSMAGWVNHQQQEVIDFLRAENQVLKEKLGKRRILLNDDQRRRLALKGKILGRKLLAEISTIFSPDTILHGHRTLIAQKWNYSDRRNKMGRPATPKEIQDLVVRMARENPTWGYDRIVGALANLGHDISDTTVGNILRAPGIEPAPQRRRTSTWKEFLKAHWEVLAAIDFTTVEVWSCRGLVTYYLLVVMEIATRRVHLAGITVNPDEAWMKQVARNLTAVDDGFRIGKRYLLMDRDAKFRESFRETLRDADVKSVRLPPRSPNLNAHLERYWLSLKTECLDRLIFFGEAMLRKTLLAYGLYYLHERNHQGLGNRLIAAGEEVGRRHGVVECRERLGGMLRYYYRAAA